MSIERIFIIFMFLSSIPSYAKSSSITGKTFILFDKVAGLQNGGTCSGFFAELDGRQYGFTNAHCIETINDCADLSLARNFTGSKNEYTLHNCEKIVLVNRHVDLTIFEFSNPLNLERKDYNFPAYSILDFEDYKNTHGQQITILGHPKGTPLKALDCEKDIDRYQSLNGFRFQHTCKTVSGMSGAIAVSATSGRVIGLNASGFASKGSGPDLSFLKETIIKFLRGNSKVGVMGKFMDEFITLDGNLTVTYLDAQFNKKHTGFLKMLKSVYENSEELPDFPILVQIDDMKDLLGLSNENPFEYLNIPTSISKEHLLERLMKLKEKGEYYKYSGQLNY